MSYPAYPEYKDSGVEWLGEVPEHWEIIKVAHGFSNIGSGTTPPSNEQKWYEGGSIPWITTSELRENLIFETKKTLTDEALSVFTSLQVHPPGSLAIAMYGATIGRLGIFGVSATTNQACCVLSGSKSISPRFAFYWLLAFKDTIISLYATGGGQPNINQETIANLRLLAPSLADQAVITTFLDHETARIDALVEEQQRLIALLKEKRQAVISHAVTKGLDPDVPMKDSGVEWLGEVPEHWGVTRLKFVALIVDCKNRTPSYHDDGEFLVVRTSNVKNQSLNVDGAFYTNEEDFNIWTRRGVPPEGSILFTREAPAGEVCLVPENMPLCLGQRMMNIIPSDSRVTSFIFDFLTSDCLSRYISSVSHGSTVSHLRVEQVYDIPLVVPPLSEQEAIDLKVSALKQQFTKLIDEAESAVKMLSERRSALISAAVTGKIDVRGLQPPEVADAKEASQQETV